MVSKQVVGPSHAARPCQRHSRASRPTCPRLQGPWRGPLTPVQDHRGPPPRFQHLCLLLQLQRPRCRRHQGPPLLLRLQPSLPAPLQGWLPPRAGGRRPPSHPDLAPLRLAHMAVPYQQMTAVCCAQQRRGPAAAPHIPPQPLPYPRPACLLCHAAGRPPPPSSPSALPAPAPAPLLLWLGLPPSAAVSCPAGGVRGRRQPSGSEAGGWLRLLSVGGKTGAAMRHAFLSIKPLKVLMACFWVSPEGVQQQPHLGVRCQGRWEWQNVSRCTAGWGAATTCVLLQRRLAERVQAQSCRHGPKPGRRRMVRPRHGREPPGRQPRGRRGVLHAGHGGAKDRLKLRHLSPQVVQIAAFAPHRLRRTLQTGGTSPAQLPAACSR
jgi:hypothetical protein